MRLASFGHPFFFLNKIACAIINTVNSSKAYNLKVRNMTSQLSKPEGFGLVKQLLSRNTNFTRRNT